MVVHYKTEKGKEGKHCENSLSLNHMFISSDADKHTFHKCSVCWVRFDSEIIRVTAGRWSLLRLHHSHRGQLRVSRSQQEVRQNKRAAGFNTAWLVLSREPSVKAEADETCSWIRHVRTLRFCWSTVVTGRKPDLKCVYHAEKGIREVDSRYGDALNLKSMCHYASASLNMREMHEFELEHFFCLFFFFWYNTPKNICHCSDWFHKIQWAKQLHLIWKWILVHNIDPEFR